MWIGEEAYPEVKNMTDTKAFNQQAADEGFISGRCDLYRIE